MRRQRRCRLLLWTMNEKWLRSRLDKAQWKESKRTERRRVEESLFFFVLFVKELVSKQRLLSYPLFFFTDFMALKSDTNASKGKGGRRRDACTGVPLIAFTALLHSSKYAAYFSEWSSDTLLHLQ